MLVLNTICPECRGAWSSIACSACSLTRRPTPDCYVCLRSTWWLVRRALVACGDFIGGDGTLAYIQAGEDFRTTEVYIRDTDDGVREAARKLRTAGQCVGLLIGPTTGE